MTVDAIHEELAALSPTRTVISVHARPSALRTSHELTELEVEYAGGACERLMLKDLGPGSLDEAAVRARPAFTIDPLREIAVYRNVLAGAQLGTARFAGCTVRPEIGRYWLFIERLEGVELYQVGSDELWRRAAARLAMLHTQLRSARTAPLIRWNHNLLRTWVDRALRFSDLPALRSIHRSFDRLADRILLLPTGLVHGELYASNILVDAGCDRFAPIDWETAGVGPQLVDLAALTAGRWSDSDREALALAYFEAAPEWTRLEDLLDALDLCRLQLAVQWLGWSDAWSPPPEHAHDWAGDVDVLADRLGIT